MVLRGELMPRILIVDDEPQIRRILSVFLSDSGFDVAEAETGERALSVAESFRPDIALLDINMPGMNGLRVLTALLEAHSNLGCVMMTAYGTIRSAVEAMKSGAFDYLAKPFDNDELLMIINRALEIRNLSREVEELRNELSSRYGFNEIIGISAKLQAVFSTMAKVAPVDATVLIEGESGTGKELVARAIHRRSKRSAKPFVAVNCGAIPQSLVEAEFFGHERGAFTDARETRAGRFEQAQGGTLFLDEIGELQLDAQVKLLRVLQDREVVKIGGRSPIKIDVRIIAATNVDLLTAVDSSKFRKDLYWRLNVVKITMPSLRDRREDIPLIIDHMFERFNRELRLGVKSMTPEARRLLEIYDWPGNVRELENVICGAIITCENSVVRAQDLPPRLRGAIAVGGQDSGKLTAIGDQDIDNMTLADVVKDVIERLEKTIISARLARMAGNRTATAESLGISRKTLFNKMRQYGFLVENLEDRD
ncbi:MAG: sigma-54-dependent Fis family transcriptional regulator [Chloracidobacterium sp.]|nr:sigma-54-dependent Fis family transcriptional regulator [Chloracidobacterium sp.]